MQTRSTPNRDISKKIIAVPQLFIINNSYLCATMTKRDTDIAYFLSFCIEQYKRHISTSGSNVMALFVQYGVDQYLIDNFDILHTQSSQWLMEEIDEFIKRAKKESV